MRDILIIANFCGDFSEKDNGRFIYLCKKLSKKNHVEIITSDFRHSSKSHKTPLTYKWPFKITFLHEPGYKKNICLQRFLSHHAWGKEVKKYLLHRKKPDVIYCAVPSLTAALNAAKFCRKNYIRFIIDIQDLWPEAFYMVFHIPIISNFVFLPFKQIANRIYSSANEIVAVSQTYVDRALEANRSLKKGYVVFLGTDLEIFDDYAKKNPWLRKSQEEIWIAYCGTLGSSYDITCVIDAISIVGEKYGKINFLVMGDGPRKKEFVKYACEKGISAHFTGFLPYPIMCGKLVACDIAVNPITHGAAQSIINKHADYAAAGLPILNTQECEEYCKLVSTYEMGFNCNNHDANDLANKLEQLIVNKKLRVQMGLNARKCAEERFNRKNSYLKIIDIMS